MRSGSLNQPTGYKMPGWQIALIVLVLAGGGIWHTANVMHETYTVNPEKIYKRTFVNPISHITDLTGGGNISGSYDIWLHFKCPVNDMQLVEQSLFHGEKLVGPSLAWFTEHVPQSADEQQRPGSRAPKASDVELLYSTRRTATTVNNQWLLHNSHTSDYYYRSWGY